MQRRWGKGLRGTPHAGGGRGATGIALPVYNCKTKHQKHAHQQASKPHTHTHTHTQTHHIHTYTHHTPPAHASAPHAPPPAPAVRGHAGPAAVVCCPFPHLQSLEASGTILFFTIHIYNKNSHQNPLVCHSDSWRRATPLGEVSRKEGKRSQGARGAGCRCVLPLSTHPISRS